MNKELIFAKTLEDLRKLAKEQGNCVSEEQVRDAFKDLSLDEEQLQHVFDYLVKHKVGIGQAVVLDDYLSDEEKNYLQDYLDELDELPVYSDGEKRAYTISAMAGEADAQAKLIEIHLKEVVEIAKLYTGQGALLEDLIGEGNVALAMCVTMLGGLDTPDEVDGAIAKMIMNAMEDFIEETASNEKADNKVADKVNKVMEKAKVLAEELSRKVTIEELVSETGMSEKAIREAIKMSGNQIEYIEYNE